MGNIINLNGFKKERSLLGYTGLSRHQYDIIHHVMAVMSKHTGKPVEVMEKTEAVKHYIGDDVIQQIRVGREMHRELVEILDVNPALLTGGERDPLVVLHTVDDWARKFCMIKGHSLPAH